MNERHSLSLMLIVRIICVVFALFLEASAKVSELSGKLYISARLNPESHHCRFFLCHFWIIIMAFMCYGILFVAKALNSFHIDRDIVRNKRKSFHLSPTVMPKCPCACLLFR